MYFIVLKCKSKNKIEQKVFCRSKSWSLGPINYNADVLLHDIQEYSQISSVY